MQKPLNVVMAYGNKPGTPNIIDDLKQFDADYRTPAAAWEFGPEFQVGADGVVRVFVDTGPIPGALALLSIKLQTNLGGTDWADHCAGDALTVVGVAPNQTIESKAYPLVQNMDVIANRKYEWSFREVQGQFVRVGVKGNAAAGQVRIRAGF